MKKLPSRNSYDAAPTGNEQSVSFVISTGTVAPGAPMVARNWPLQSASHAQSAEQGAAVAAGATGTEVTVGTGVWMGVLVGKGVRVWVGKDVLVGAGRVTKAEMPSFESLVVKLPAK